MHFLKSSLHTTAILSFGMIALTGCGGDDQIQQSQQPRQEQPSQRATDQSSSKPPSRENVSLFTRQPTPRDQRALAVEDHQIDGIEVSLLKVRRSSDSTLTVNWKYTNTTNEKIKLADQATHEHDSGWIAQAYLIDNVNQKKHPVVRAVPSNSPLTSKNISWSIHIEPGSSYKVWAKFPVPPADVKSISIYIPGISPIEDVPISN